LVKHKPQVVVFDEATLSYDGVPSDVRIPLVYQAVVARYVPVAHVGSYEVLRPRRPGQGPDPAFWSSVLGTQVDLGFLPDAMRASVPRPSPEGPDVPYLTVGRNGLAPQGTTVSVPLRFGSVNIELTLEAQASRGDFSIPLSRVWAWALSHHPVLSGSPSPGWGARISVGALPAGQLY
jgi:hypothetical protein